VKSTVENVGPTRVKLAVELPFDELKPSLDAAYRKIAAQIRIPGFRPGKAPARIIDQRVGRGAVLEEALNEALPRAYTAAVRETGVKALGQPDIEVTKLDDGQAVSFTAEVDVRPEITVPELDGLEVSVDNAEVSDADVEQQFDALRDRFASLKGVERAVENGDFVSLDLTASVNGVEVEGGSAKGLSYEVGSEDLIPGIDEVLVGMSAGDTSTFTTTLQQGEFAGQDAEVTVTVNSVKERERPEADDEFAQLASEFDTVDELRDDIRTRLGRAKVLEQGSQARDKVLERLIDQVDVELPASAIQSEVEMREHDIVHSLNHDDALFEQFLASQGKSREEFTAELRESAEKSVKAQFILDAIADAEELSVSEVELTEYIVRQAARYNMAPREFADQIVQAGNLPALMADVRRNKALSNVLERATVTDADGNRVDLSQLRPADLEDAEFTEDEVELGDDDAGTGAGTGASAGAGEPTED
jgi:trigger factor